MSLKKEGWLHFLKLCESMARSKEGLDHFFELFLAPEEKEMLSSRFSIIKELLNAELTQREIAQKHEVSIAQITRGSNALKRLDPEYKKLLKGKLDH